MIRKKQNEWYRIRRLAVWTHKQPATRSRDCLVFLGPAQVTDRHAAFACLRRRVYEASASASNLDKGTCFVSCLVVRRRSSPKARKGSELSRHAMARPAPQNEIDKLTMQMLTLLYQSLC